MKSYFVFPLKSLILNINYLYTSTSYPYQITIHVHFNYTMNSHFMLNSFRWKINKLNPPDIYQSITETNGRTSARLEHSKRRRGKVHLCFHDALFCPFSFYFQWFLGETRPDDPKHFIETPGAEMRTITLRQKQQKRSFLHMNVKSERFFRGTWWIWSHRCSIILFRHFVYKAKTARASNGRTQFHIAMVPPGCHGSSWRASRESGLNEVQKIHFSRSSLGNFLEICTSSSELFCVHTAKDSQKKNFKKKSTLNMENVRFERFESLHCFLCSAVEPFTGLTVSLMFSSEKKLLTAHSWAFTNNTLKQRSN